jgi:hypothetical protein
MPALTSSKHQKRQFPVTRPRADHEGRESDAVLFAMRVADLAWTPRMVHELSFGKAPPRGWTLAPELRERTAQELDALASHDRRRQAGVLSRVLEDGRLVQLEGIGSVWMSRDRGLRIEWGPVMTSAEMMVDYALAMLLDDTQPYGKLFSRCHYHDCRRFFLAPPPKRQGQYRYKYCSPEHQKAADATKVADRVKAHRLGIPVAEFRKLRNRK